MSEQHKANGTPAQAAYIVGTGIFLPNEPIENDEIEEVLGRINGRSSQVKKWCLDYNGIETRYYALDPNTGEQTHTNAEMTAEAARVAIGDAGLELEDVDCLACGTSSADQVIPSHASMVHGELKCPPCEVISTTGVCCSGMSAMKYAYMNVLTGAGNSLATGSELASVSFRASHFLPALNRKELSDLEEEPTLAFENDFLRWMLSDGAGAVVIGNKPRDEGVSLRIDWIDLISFANEEETCMYFGANKKPDGTLVGFRTIDDADELIRDGYLSLAQDVRVLRSALPKCAKEALLRSTSRHSVRPDSIDWILPHYSSEGFRDPIKEGILEEGFEIPEEKWFTNLKWKGNTGAASIYIIIDELVSSGRAEPGQHILCAVPESARFTFSVMHLTVV